MVEVHTSAEERLSDADLAAMLASRICHDLTSPLGAIANGVELLALSGLEPTPEMELIAQSVESANARIRFFRLAYGPAGQQGVSSTEVTRILGALSRVGRIGYDWTVTADLPRDEVRAVLLLVQCLEAAMPAGGHIRVARETGNWQITAEGARLRIDPVAWDAVGPLRADPPKASSLVQFALLAGALDSLGRSLAMTHLPNRIDVSF